MEQTNTHLAWTCQVRPDDQGEAVIRIPKGLINANLILTGWSKSSPSSSAGRRRNPGPCSRTTAWVR